MATKTTTISPELDPAMRALVQRVQPTVEHALGRAAARVEVAWERGGPDEFGQSTLRLRLNDAGVEGSQEFPPSQLSQDSFFRWQVNKLWDDVLSDRIRRAREAVHQDLESSEV